MTLTVSKVKFLEKTAWNLRGNCSYSYILFQQVVFLFSWPRNASKTSWKLTVYFTRTKKKSRCCQKRNAKRLFLYTHAADPRSSVRPAGLHALPSLVEVRCDNDHPHRGACGYRDLLSTDPVRGHLGGMEKQTLRGGGGHRPQRNHHGRWEGHWIICWWIYHDRWNLSLLFNNSCFTS